MRCIRASSGKESARGAPDVYSAAALVDSPQQETSAKVSSPPGLDISLRNRTQSSPAGTPVKASPSARVPYLPTEVSFSQLGLFRKKLRWGEGLFSFSSCSLFGFPRRLKGSSSGLVPPCNTVTRGEHGQTNFYRAEWFSGGGLSWPRGRIFVLFVGAKDYSFFHFIQHPG